MPVVVSDASVIIDLQRAGLLHRAVRLPDRLCVPDVLFERELNGPLGRQLLQLGLAVADLNPAELAAAIRLRRRHTALSVAGSFAVALAKTRRWLLLTEDSSVRRAADAAQLDARGLLWLFDALETSEVCNCAELEEALNRLAGHPRCGLVRADITKQLNRYRRVR